MKIQEINNEIVISDITDFDLIKTFECGQCFRWSIDEHNNSVGDKNFDVAYIGVAHGRVLKLRQSKNSVILSCSMKDVESIWHDYFDLDRDYSEIRKNLCIDDYMMNATNFGKGIRLLSQDKWEALCSFIISQNNNIPRIKAIINTLCSNFGDSIMFEKNQYYTFPSAKQLATLSSVDLTPLRCGYRAEYIIRAAKSITNGEINLDKIADSTPEIARSELKKLHGVGDKVADCVMLFGLHMLDAFPLDVWMKRAVSEHYGPDFDPSIFSPYSGIAQQYIFHYTRNA